MEPVAPELAAAPDRLRWNARYRGRPRTSFTPHPLVARALALPLPDGPVLDLASGPSGSALAAAAVGRRVTAVDISEVALGLLGEEAGRRGLTGLITLVHADLTGWRPQPGGYALVACTGYWDATVFPGAAAAVAPGGLLAWEAFTREALPERPGLDPAWCLGPGEPARALPGSFAVLEEQDLPGRAGGGKRRLLARRRASGERQGRVRRQASDGGPTVPLA